MSEIIIEQLLEQRDSYLNMLKHLDFQLILEPTDNEIQNIEKLQEKTVEQIKKIEQELAYISNSKI
ncbi:MAG: hypothetical protein K5790_02910 [Nitrosopumilus sp.]|uniref:hypothetical protein n=1 Tax=Nitrosopumilus sp. TaxID=2024843 RepID=UPI00247CB044|nr:hypothetical protein [Nitrosopumilus sp.]MCV0392227.1 hypothetical protein [Nitrosopumilus sp.]